MVIRRFRIFTSKNIASNPHLRCLAASGCDGHEVSLNASGPTVYHNHDKYGAEIAGEKVMLAMGGECSGCGVLSAIQEGRTTSSEYNAFIFLQPVGWGPTNKILGLDTLINSEFMQLRTGFHYLKRAQLHSKPAGTSNKKLDIVDTGPGLTWKSLALWHVRTSFISRIIKEVREELRIRGTKTVVNKGSQRDNISYRGKMHRLRFARGGARTFLDITDYAVNRYASGYMDSSLPKMNASGDLVDLAQVPISNSKALHLYSPLSATTTNAPFKWADTKMVTNSLKGTISESEAGSMLVLGFRLTGVADRSYYSPQKEHVSVIGAWAAPGVVDISYLADCVEAARFQSRLFKLHGPAVKVDNLKASLIEEFGKKFKHRDLGIEIGASQSISAIPPGTLKKRTKPTDNIDVTFKIRGSCTVDSGNDKSKQRVRTFLEQILRGYDTVKRLK